MINAGNVRKPRYGPYPGTARSSDPAQSVVLNPDTRERMRFAQGDKVVVLAED